MITFDGHCPHCDSDKGFNAFGMSYYIIGERDYETFPLDEKQKGMKQARLCLHYKNRKINARATKE